MRGDTLLVTDLLAQTLLTVDLTPVTYTDVPADAWYAEAVAAATERGITGGTGDGLFSPDAPVTRATFAVMLSRLHLNTDGNAVIDGEAAFSDVPTDAWYAPAVRWAADQGIVSGYGGGLYGPDDTIAREQLVVMLWRYAGSPLIAGKQLDFTDDEVGSWAVDALAWAKENGILQGYNGAVDLKGNASRVMSCRC